MWQGLLRARGLFVGLLTAGAPRGLRFLGLVVLGWVFLLLIIISLFFLFNLLLALTHIFPFLVLPFVFLLFIFVPLVLLPLVLRRPVSRSWGLRQLWGTQGKSKRVGALSNPTQK